MSEEQSGFKVTDRRLFNADGTPRDVEREETTDQTTAAAAAATEARQAVPGAQNADVLPSSTTTSSQTEPRATDEQSFAGAASAAHAPPEMREEDSYTEEDIPGANDPASFVNHVMFVVSIAAAALGLMENPMTGQRDVDLPSAKHWIDVLGMLQQKTRGNLSLPEQQILESYLADLRMQYYSLSNAPQPSAPRRFTGRDITGGK